MSGGTSGKAGILGGGAPDFTGMANAQSQGQQNLLTQQTYANRPDVNTPYGSYNWTSTPAQGTPPQYGMAGGNDVPEGLANGSLGQGGVFGGGGGSGSAGGSGGDAGGGAGGGADGSGWTPESWQLDINLSPEEQAALDQSRGIRSGMNSAAQGMLDRGISGKSVEDALYSRLTSRLDPQWNQRQDQQRTQLYNMGLREGDAAFGQQMDEFNRNRNDAYSQAQYQSVLGGDASQAQQVNILNALRGGNGPQMPGMPNFNQAGVAQAPDLIGAGNAQAAYAAQNNPMNLVGQLAPYAFSAYMLSDARLKTNIRYLDAEALPGVKWATWDWRAGGHGKGVIAQDVAKVRPDLVAIGEDGFLRVDYSRIGA